MNEPRQPDDNLTPGYCEGGSRDPWAPDLPRWRAWPKPRPVREVRKDPGLGEVR